MIYPLVDEGLGNSSYLVDIGDGRALIVDPTRDPNQYLDSASHRGLRVAFSAETHLHADFVSGGRELAAQGAVVVASAGGNLAFPHQALHDGEEIDLGGLALRAISTAGHTLEHVSYLLLEGPQPLALFTGGSLLVGSVARTDLVDPARTEELARTAYRSIQERILTLPDDLPVYPTHGGGSFCSAAAGSERTTTIGRERAANPLLAAPDEDAFVARLLGSLGTYPTYFGRLPEVNRRGPRVFGATPPLTQRPASDVHDLAAAGAAVVDVRPIADFAAGHISGALSIALRPAFGTWLGWLVEPEQPLVFVLGKGQDRGDVVRQALKVGYEDIRGELTGGMAAWRAEGRPEKRLNLATAADITVQPVIDVRQRSEFDAGHIPEAQNVELGVMATASEIPAGPVTVHCGHGERAMTAASILQRGGRDEVTVLTDGPDQWSAATGIPLTVSG